MPYDPFVWAAASIAIYAAATNLHWYLHASALDDVRSVGRLTDHPTVQRAASLAFFLGIPLAAVALRVARPSHLGLTWAVSPRGAATAVLVAAVVVAWVNGMSWLHERAADGGARPRLALPPAADVPEMLLRAVTREAHWALYRAGALSVLGPAGSLASLGLVALECCSSPWRRAELGDADAAADLARGAALAIQSAIVFAVTGSSLAALALHVPVAALTARGAWAEAEALEVRPTVV